MKKYVFVLPFLILGCSASCEPVQLTCPTHEDLSISLVEGSDHTNVNFTGTIKDTDLTVSGSQRIQAKEPNITKSFPVASLTKNAFNCHLLYTYLTPESKSEQPGAVVIGVNLPAEYKNCKLESDGSDSILCEVG